MPNAGGIGLPVLRMGYVMQLAGVLVLERFFRLVRAWLLLRHLLRRVAQTELVEALPRLPGDLNWSPLRFSWSRAPLSGLRRSVELLQRLIPEPPPGGRLTDLLAGIASASGREQLGVEVRADKFTEELKLRQQLNQHLREAYDQLGDVDHPAVEEFFAVRLIAYLQQVFIQLRYWLMTTMGTGLLLIAGVAAYAFEPKRFAMLLAWGILSALGAATVAIFVQMSRDATLSAIGGTKAGKVTYDWPFVSSVLTYGVVPVLGLVASQFPFLGRWVVSLLDPLARLLRVN
jgi:hypothetical protein